MTLIEKLEEMYEREEWNPEWFAQIKNALNRAGQGQFEKPGYNFLGWVKRNDYMPNNDERVLTYTPCVEDEYKYRVMSGQFVKTCTEVEWWIYLHKLGAEKL